MDDVVEELARVLWDHGMDMGPGSWDEMVEKVGNSKLDPWGFAEGNVEQYRRMAQCAISAGFSR